MATQQKQQGAMQISGQTQQRPSNERQQPSQQQHQQHQQQSQQLSDPFSPFSQYSSPYGGESSALTPWGGLGGGALAPWASQSPFGYSGNQGLDLIGRAMASAAPELARLQAKANAALPPLLRLDVHETDQDIVIRADVPGAVDEGIKIDVDKDNMLRVVVDRSETQEMDDERSGIIYHRSERTQGRQWRSLQLPSNVDGSKVSARLDNGVLQIVAPKTSQLDAGRRRVPVIGA